MSLPPIVERELRVASRRKATWRMRLWTTVLALAFGMIFLGFGSVSRNPGQAGSYFFELLVFYISFLCLFGGASLTSDSLSSEKREGTLGLLFLTDLKGYDVVLGKFAATGLNALYGLLALMPVLALTLVMGGVTGGEFWRFMLSAINLLFYSLAVGIWVSAYQRDDRGAQFSAFGMLLIMGVGTWAAYFIVRQIPGGAGVAPWVGGGPITPVVIGMDSYYTRDPHHYWIALGTSAVTALLFLAHASWLLPRSWQERPVIQKAAPASATVTAAKSATSFSQRRKLLDQDPVTWLARGRTSSLVAAWCCALLPAGIHLLVWAVGDAGDVFGVFMVASWMIMLPVKLLVASEACRFFVEARRSGAIELLVCTPLTSGAVISGQWRALRRTFLWPLLIISASVVLPPLAIVGQHILTYGFSGPLGHLSEVLPALMIGGYGLLALWVKVIALGIFGMWQGLTCRRPVHAFRWTVVFGLILPAFICIPFVPDIILIAWSFARLGGNMRKIVLTQQQFDAQQR